jgi:hypothetical protein
MKSEQCAGALLLSLRRTATNLPRDLHPASHLYRSTEEQGFRGPVSAYLLLKPTLELSTGIAGNFVLRAKHSLKRCP